MPALVDEGARRPWLRIAAEGAAIVISILLAFSIDAWWDSYRDREEEQAVLRGLEEEFLDYVNQLDGLVMSYDVKLRRLRYLLNNSLDDGTRIPEDSLDVILLSLLAAPTFDPGSGTRDALVSSGRLELLRRQTLREELAGWQSKVDELRDNQMAVRTFVLETVVPYLSVRGLPLTRTLSMSPTWVVGPDDPEAAYKPPAVPDLTPASVARYRQTVGSPEFQGLVAYVYWWSAGSSKEGRAVRGAAQAILRLISEMRT